MQRHVEVAIAQHHGALGVYAAVQQAGGGKNGLRLAPQRHSGRQAIEADIHNRTVRERRVKGVGVFAVKVALIARGVLTVVDEGFA